MPAGSGPQLTAPVTSGSITTVANTITITTNTFRTGSTQGILVTAYLTGTPSATQTVQAQCFQGTGVTGTQVGITQLVTFTGTTQDNAAYVFQDTSAFAQNNPGGTYTVGFTTNVGTNTINYAFIELETLAPVS